MSILLFASFDSWNVLDPFEIFEYSESCLVFFFFFVPDAFSYLFAEIFQSLLLSFGSASSFLDKSSNFLIFL